MANVSWARTVATYINKHLRDVEKANLRDHKIGVLMLDKGKIKYNMTSDTIDWRIKYRNRPVTGYTGTQPRNFTPTNVHKVAQLEYRGYVVADAITKRERLANRGVESIVKVFEQQVPELMEDMEEAFNQEYYTDGQAAGNEDKMEGLRTMLQPLITTPGAGADTITVATNADAGAYAAADPVAVPSDTYANLSTVRGNEGGALLTGDSWPFGTADAEYDYFSPIICNYVSTYFGGSTANWQEQGLEAIRFGLTHTRRNAGKKGQVDLVVMDRELYRQALAKLDTKERVQVTSNKRGLQYFGFDDTFNFDGADITSDYSCPANEAYGLNIDCMELLSMQDRLFKAEGPRWDGDTGSYKTLCDFLGNLKFKSPRNFFRLVDCSTNGPF